MHVMLFQIKSNEDIIKNAALLVLDGNLTIEALGTALELAQKHEIPGKQLKYIY